MVVMEENRTGLCKIRTGSNSLVQEPNRWWGSWRRIDQALSGSCKNRTGNRTGGGVGGESNIPESVSLYLKGNRTGLCKNRTGGGHGGESKVSIYI